MRVDAEHFPALANDRRSSLAFGRERRELVAAKPVGDARRLPLLGEEHPRARRLRGVAEILATISVTSATRRFWAARFKDAGWREHLDAYGAREAVRAVWTASTALYLSDMNGSSDARQDAAFSLRGFCARVLRES